MYELSIVQPDLSQVERGCLPRSSICQFPMGLSDQTQSTARLFSPARLRLPSPPRKHFDLDIRRRSRREAGGHRKATTRFGSVSFRHRHESRFRTCSKTSERAIIGAKLWHRLFGRARLGERVYAPAGRPQEYLELTYSSIGFIEANVKIIPFWFTHRRAFIT